MPDAKLLAALRGWRGRGRDDYPVQVLCGTLLLTIVRRHPSLESCLGELQRNAALRALTGLTREGDVPKKWNLSRFLEVLGREPHLTLLHAVFDTMIQRLEAVVPDLGRRTAGDASGLSARRESKAQGAQTGLPALTASPGGVLVRAPQPSDQLPALLAPVPLGLLAHATDRT